MEQLASFATVALLIAGAASAAHLLVQAHAAIDRRKEDREEV